MSSLSIWTAACCAPAGAGTATAIAAIPIAPRVENRTCRRLIFPSLQCLGLSCPLSGNDIPDCITQKTESDDRGGTGKQRPISTSTWCLRSVRGGKVHVTPARSNFSNALNLCRSAIAALVRSPWRYCPLRLPGGAPLPLAPPCNRQRPFFIAGDRLLRVRRERPRRRRAAEQRDELAPLHSITSSAATSSLSGTVRPSILAVEALMTS